MCPNGTTYPQADYSFGVPTL